MSAPWGDNSRPEEGCGFCSNFRRMKDDPQLCEGCPHDPYAECPVCGAPGSGCITCLAELRCDGAETP